MGAFFILSVSRASRATELPLGSDNMLLHNL